MLAKITLTVDQNPAKHFFGIGSSIKSKPWRVQTEEVSIFFQQQVNHWLLSILHNDRVRFSTRYVCSVARLTQQHCQGGIKVDQADSNVVWLFVCERSVYRTKSTSGSTKNRRKKENIRWFPDFQISRRFMEAEGQDPWDKWRKTNKWKKKAVFKTAKLLKSSGFFNKK